MGKAHKALLGTLLLLFCTAAGFSQASKPNATTQSDPSKTSGTTTNSKARKKPKKKIVKSDAEWRRQLSRMQYRVTRQGHTERARTGRYWRHKVKGTYTCVCCDEALFSSSTKFKSGTGWPSFWAPVSKEQVTTKLDRSIPFLGARIEVLCSRCDAHLGHVFRDGPKPTGLRYCINSAALGFEKKKTKADQEAKKEKESKDEATKPAEKSDG